ncbi:DUF1697 domain-containing protein [Nesterenkonia ebinurensis]|uniref:DUF1697 domain-containing protein n=1 Tax=Nesterenkonia ebinurensis TaxID=2608252 RepID=UPI001CC4D0A1|nr:DUF1697 domain-containing protein [Nesterenkonia ebinurensis]
MTETMTSYCALLRGIGPSNPNMRNDRLREVFEHLGFANVASVLSSGNIVFSTDDGAPTPEIEGRIQSALQSELGISGGTILRGRAECAALAARKPFGDLEHSKETYLTVTFLKEHLAPCPDPFPTPDMPQVRIRGYDAEARAILAVVDTTGSKTPDYMGWLERTFSKEITTRTWNTVTKILKKLPAG